MMPVPPLGGGCLARFPLKPSTTVHLLSAVILVSLLFFHRPFFWAPPRSRGRPVPCIGPSQPRKGFGGAFSIPSTPLCSQAGRWVPEALFC